MTIESEAKQADYNHICDWPSGDLTNQKKKTTKKKKEKRSEEKWREEKKEEVIYHNPLIFFTEFNNEFFSIKLSISY